MADVTTITTQISDLKNIIAAPLVATVQADVYAAVAFVKFIEEYGFEKSDTISTRITDKGFDVNEDTSHLGKLKMVTFYYDYEVIEDGKPVVRMVRVTIPFLSLVPLPLLQVNDAEYRFDIRITGVYSSEVIPADGSPPSLLRSSSVNEEPLPRVLATYTPFTADNQVNAMAPSMVANMRIKINVRQGDIPAGISSMLNIISDSTSRIIK